MYTVGVIYGDDGRRRRRRSIEGLMLRLSGKNTEKYATK